MNIFKRLFCKKEISQKVERLPWDDFVSSMHDVGLNHVDADVVKVLYSRDRSRRYVILRNNKGFFTYGFEILYQFDEDEIMYLRPNDKQGYWSDFQKGFSVYDSVETAEKNLVCEPEYKAYFSDVDE